MRSRSGVVDELREAIGAELALGASLARVDAESIDPADLDEEQKAALWLFAWSRVHSAHEWIARPGHAWS